VSAVKRPKAKRWILVAIMALTCREQDRIFLGIDRGGYLLKAELAYERTWNLPRRKPQHPTSKHHPHRRHGR
jgi:hypothetical protein